MQSVSILGLNATKGSSGSTLRSTQSRIWLKKYLAIWKDYYRRCRICNMNKAMEMGAKP